MRRISLTPATALGSKESEVSDRYVTTWRKTGEQMLDWDYYVSDTLDEAYRVIANLKAQGVKQFNTFRIAENMPELSSAR